MNKLILSTGDLEHILDAMKFYVKESDQSNTYSEKLINFMPKVKLNRFKNNDFGLKQISG